MCKTKMQIKDGCKINQSQNAERRNLDSPLEKVK